jgi:hypothetical protein
MSLKLGVATTVMYVVIVVVTRSVSISVKTLHTLLNANRLTAMKQHTLEIVYVNDDAFEKKAVFLKKAKACDRLVWLNFSVHVDDVSLDKMLDKFINGYHCLVLPGVTPGIDWDMFKKKVLSDSNEPVSQMGLNFDTEVGKSIGEHLYTVTSTDPKAWAIDTKPVLKAIKGSKGDGTISANTTEMFKTFIERDVKVYAFTDAHVVLTYPHECVGNLLSAAGVQTYPH